MRPTADGHNDTMRNALQLWNSLLFGRKLSRGKLLKNVNKIFVQQRLYTEECLSSFQQQKYPSQKHFKE